MTELRTSNGILKVDPTLQDIYEALQTSSYTPTYSVSVKNHYGDRFVVLYKGPQDLIGEYHYKRGFVEIDLTNEILTKERIAAILYDFKRGSKLKDLSDIPYANEKHVDRFYRSIKIISNSSWFIAIVFILIQSQLKFDINVDNRLVLFILIYLISITVMDTEYKWYYGLEKMQYLAFVRLLVFSIILLGLLINSFL